MKQPTAVTLLFPDDTVLSGTSATDVLARLGRLQWDPREVEGMKAGLSDRAFRALGATLDPLLPDDEFLTALDASGLCAVLYGGTKAERGLRWPVTAEDPDDAAEGDLAILRESFPDLETEADDGKP